MVRDMKSASPPPGSTIAWLAGFATLGLVASASSTWVHYQLLQNPAYSSVCDVNATVSCTEAYGSRFGSVAGIPVAYIGLLFFALVLGLIAIGSRSKAAAPNLPGYVFALSTGGL